MNAIPLKELIHIPVRVLKQNFDWMKSMKSNTILIQKFKKEKRWAKKWVNTLFLLITLARL